MNSRTVTCLANGLDAEAYRTGRVRAITRVAKTWVSAVRRARSAGTHGESTGEG
jgi:hypothetical protein